MAAWFVARFVMVVTSSGEFSDKYITAVYLYNNTEILECEIKPQL